MTKPSKKCRVRQYHHKTRSGCTACKKRRVKCDETKPVCKQCRPFPQYCNYVEARPSDEVDLLLPISPNQWTGHAKDDAQTFNLYCNRTAAFLGDYAETDVEVFRRSIPRVAHSNPAIWNLVVATAYAQSACDHGFAGDHERGRMDTDRSRQRYVRGLAQLTAPGNPPEPEVMILAGLLLYGCETFRDPATSQVGLHFGSIIRVLTESKKQNCIIEAIKPLAFRAVMHVADFGPAVTLKFDARDEELTTEIQLPTEFTTYNEVRAHSFKFYRQRMYRARLERWSSGCAAMGPFLVNLEKCRQLMLNFYLQQSSTMVANARDTLRMAVTIHILQGLQDDPSVDSMCPIPSIVDLTDPDIIRISYDWTGKTEIFNTRHLSDHQNRQGLVNYPAVRFVNDQCGRDLMQRIYTRSILTKIPS